MHTINKTVAIFFIFLLSFNLLGTHIGHMLHFVTHSIQGEHYHSHTHRCRTNNNSNELSEHHHSNFIQQVFNIAIEYGTILGLQNVIMLMFTLKCAIPNVHFQLYPPPPNIVTGKIALLIKNISEISIETPTPPP